MVQKFEVELLEKAFDFLEKLDTKAKNKIFQNLERAKYETNPQLFKKLRDEIWEFRTLFFGKQYRLLAFWDKTDKQETFVLATHGIVKKTSKVDKKEIDKAERIRQEYFKIKEDEKIHTRRGKK